MFGSSSPIRSHKAAWMRNTLTKVWRAVAVAIVPQRANPWALTLCLQGFGIGSKPSTERRNQGNRRIAAPRLAGHNRLSEPHLSLRWSQPDRSG